MYTLSQFGETALPVYMTDYDNSVVPAQLAFVETTAGVFDGNGDGRSRQAFPLAISYKATVAQDTLGANKTTLDGLRKLVGTRAFLYRYADSNSTIVHRCQARLVSLNQQRPYDNRNVIHEITLNFQQLSPWLGTTNGTGWNFDSGYVFDGGRYFDEGITPTTLSLATTLITVTNNGNYPAYDSIVTVTCGSEALESLTIWNMTTNCRWFWTGTVNPAAELQINTGACTVTINGIDDYNHFSLDDPFHRNEHWMEFAPGANNLVVLRFGGGNNSTISFVFSDTWA